MVVINNLRLFCNNQIGRKSKMITTKYQIILGLVLCIRLLFFEFISGPFFLPNDPLFIDA